MIVHRLYAKKGLAVVTPEDVNDLWRLRRLVAPGNLVASETSRVVKEREQFVRPDKGERVRVRMTVRVERVKLDSTLGILRVSGVITDASSELLPKGSHHSLLITPEQRLAVKKERWSGLETRMLTEAQSGDGRYLVVSVDMREAGIGVLKGTHLKLHPSVYSGYAGKLYPEERGPTTAYYVKIEEALRHLHRPRDKIMISGPGVTKNQLANFLSGRWKEAGGALVTLEGVDVSGEDGVFATLRAPGFRRVVEGSVIARAQAILEEAIRRISVGDTRVSMALKDTVRAGDLGAVESMLVSDRVFELGVDEEELIQLINKVESMRGIVHLLDSSTDAGRQTSALGGVVALLRYPV